MSDLRAWAVKGARQRLVEIAAEAKAIVSAFPELRKRGAPPSRQESAEATANVPAPARRPRKMSAAARKRIGDAQRARWAKQKAHNSSAGDKAGNGQSAPKPDPRKKR